MRERQRLTVSRATGASEMTTEIIDDNAGFGQRIRELRESVPDMGPDAAGFLALACDSCGAKVRLAFDDPRLPDGWVACEAGDFCPRCQALS
jgi:hypothetical protein